MIGSAAAAGAWAWMGAWAHAGARTAHEGIVASKAPVLISHTGCRALADLPRNTADEELRAMADRGGVAGIIFWPYLRKQGQPMAADVIRHIEHAIKICGEDHVGIGTDGTLSATARTEQFEKDNREYIKNLFDNDIFEKGRDRDLYVFIPDLNDVRRFEMLAAMLSSPLMRDAIAQPTACGTWVARFQEMENRRFSAE